MRMLNVFCVIIAVFLTACDVPVTVNNPIVNNPSAAPSSSSSGLSPTPASPGVSTPIASPTQTPSASASPSLSPSPSSTVLPPTVSVSDQSGTEQILMTFNVNGNDPQFQALTYTCSNCPSGLVLNSNTGQVSWTPSSGQAGTIHPTFIVTNTSGLSASAGNMIVVAQNTAPPVFASISSQNVDEGSSLSLTPSASDPYGRSVTISVSSQLPSNASFSGGVFHFSPDYTQAGGYTVIFQADNGEVTSNLSVSITVNTAYLAPVINTVPNQTVSQMGTLTFQVTSTQPDGEIPIYAATNLPSGATFNTSTQIFSWVPGCNQVGTFTPSFSVYTLGGKLFTTPTITVTGTGCTPPVWIVDPSEISQGISEVIFIGTGRDQDTLLSTGLTYGYVEELECNNTPWTKSFNSSTRKLTMTNSNCHDMGPHAFVVYTQNAAGQRDYRFINVSGCSDSGVGTGGYAMESYSDMGTSFSTAGFCGAGKVYVH